MKRFNPEKEIKKIQHGKRNKIISLVFLILIVSIISYSFALYQVRHNKKLVFTVVKPFNNKDVNLSILIDGKESEKNDFPTKGTGYYFDSATCDNGSPITFDYENWEVILRANKKEKCVVKFMTPSEITLEDYLLSNVSLTNDETEDGNLRYIGANPNNYIWFNCKDYYGEKNEDNCERWRIIGIINNVETSDGSTENLVKITKSNVIPSMSWDSAGKNIWANASLKNILNGDYITPTSGIYQNTTNIRAISTESLPMLESVNWNVGGVDATSIISEYYSDEKTSKWLGLIAIISASDYGYATGGTNAGDVNVCVSSSAYNWNNECGINDWLLYANSSAESNGNKINEWLLYFMKNDRDLRTGFKYAEGSISTTNSIGSSQAYPSARPTAYLKSEIKYIGGDGTYTNPYIINAMDN